MVTELSVKLLIASEAWKDKCKALLSAMFPLHLHSRLFSTWQLASMDWAKTTAKRDENHLSSVIWFGLYQTFYDTLEAIGNHSEAETYPCDNVLWIPRLHDEGVESTNHYHTVGFQTQTLARTQTQWLATANHHLNITMSNLTASMLHKVVWSSDCSHLSIYLAMMMLCIGRDVSG